MIKSILLVILLIGINLFADTWKIQNDPYYKHKVSQFKVLQSINNIEIMMLGDSITDEGLWNELLERKIQNRGISGDTTSGIIDRLSTISPSIKKAFIMIGVNDIMRGSSEEEVFSNYKKIIASLLEKNIQVYIQSTLYIGKTRMQNFNQKIEQLNILLKDFTTKKGLIFIDLNQYLAPNKVLKNEFTDDDLHLKGKAYLIWAKAIKNYL